MTQHIDLNKAVEKLSKNAWGSYRHELESDGFEPKLLEALEEVMCIYIMAFWLGALAKVNQSDGVFHGPETIGGFDGDYIEGRSNKEVRTEILDSGGEILAGKDGRRLGGAIRAGRIRNVCENWAQYLSNMLEDRGRGALVGKRLIRLIGSDFERHSQKLIIEDPKLRESISS